MQEELKERFASVLSEVISQCAYSGDEPVSLLVQRARLVFKIASSPGLSVLDLQVSLGVQQQTIFDYMSYLMESGLVERRRLNRRNGYYANLDTVLSQPDILLLLHGLLALCSTPEYDDDDVA
jgi:predicted transcriptional regulator